MLAAKSKNEHVEVFWQELFSMYQQSVIVVANVISHLFFAINFRQYCMYKQFYAMLILTDIKIFKRCLKSCLKSCREIIK